jgi:transcriptional regulator
MTPFLPKDPSDVRKLVEAYPLCWVLSASRNHRHATPLPLLPEKSPDGGVESLLGHMARSNPLRMALEQDPRATILCMGPQGYISPELVSNPTWGPTWNYAVCRFETEVRFVPEETDSALSQLAAALEGVAPDSWTPKRMGDRYDPLKRRIIAFRATVIETHPRFKLGQDESDAVFNEIVEGLDDRTLAEWMSRARS